MRPQLSVRVVANDSPFPSSICHSHGPGVRTKWIEALRDRVEVDESRYGTLMLEYREGIVPSDRPAD